MPINFDSLPTESPNALPEVGVYLAEVESATLKTSKAGGEYIELKLKLMDKTKKTYGVVYDILSESENQAIQFKIGRFLRACGIPLHGSLELKDIVKLIPVSKVVTTKIKIQTGTNGYSDKAVTDMFGSDVYWTEAEYDSVKDINTIGGSEPTPVNSDFMTVPDDAGDNGVPFDGESTPSASY